MFIMFCSLFIDCSFLIVFLIKFCILEIFVVVLGSGGSCLLGGGFEFRLESGGKMFVLVLLSIDCVKGGNVEIELYCGLLLYKLNKLLFL